MGFRFRKSFRIIPGVRLNLSKSGTSWSFGGRGVTMNVKGRRIRGTVDLPGGLSYQEQATLPEEQPQQLMQQQPTTDYRALGRFIVGAVVLALFVLLIFPKR